MSDFKLVMLSAMFENGGNTTHRFLDGHPELFVYPFESQLGTFLVNDYLVSLYPHRYRWPEFGLAGTPEGDYRAIIDEECKVRARVPHVSKFRHWRFDFSDDERRERYLDLVARMGGRSRANNVEAFFRSTFLAWRNRKASGREHVYVGYSPIVVLDTEKILEDFPNAHVVHVARNPWSAYADTRKRPVPQGLARYMHGWCLNQYFALMYERMFPGRVHVVRLEDTLANPMRTLGGLCEKIGVKPAKTLKRTTWNGQLLRTLYPWGTVRTPTPEANRKTALELSDSDRAEVRIRAKPFLEILKYDRFLKG